MEPPPQGNGADEAGDGALFCLSCFRDFKGGISCTVWVDVGKAGNGGQVKKILFGFREDPCWVGLGCHSAGADGGIARAGC